MPVDPRLNCAAEICCHPTLRGDEAHASRVAILEDLGLSQAQASTVATAMKEQGLCFMPQALADTIREVAFP